MSGPDAFCRHPKVRLTRRVVRNGSVQYVEQCFVCGRSMNQPVAHAEVYRMYGEIEPPEFDEQLEQRYAEERAKEVAAGQSAQRGAWRSKYREYLASPAWALRRERVMHRCGGVCEGCGDAPAREVHHLTYKHVFDELLFELVGLCGACHERAHAESSEN